MWKKLTAVYALVSTACASWQTQHGPPSRAVDESGKHGEQYIKVELNSGKRWDIYAPTIVGDSLIGRNTRVVIPETERIAVATADIRSITRHKFSLGRTLVVAAVIVGAAVAIGSAGGSSSSSSSNSSCSSATPATSTS